MSAADTEKYPYHPPAPPFMDNDPYELVVRSQAGGEEIVSALGALAEIREAVVALCERQRPAPAYKPQLLKDRLEPLGWVREARVPPFRAELDHLTINERFDLLKFFAADGGEVGVALEMDSWMVHRDMLKFRRGLERGQIVAGVIVQPDYYDTYYCFEHWRHLNEPLFGELPVVYCCPRGPGLREPPLRKNRNYSAFLMPRQPRQ